MMDIDARPALKSLLERRSVAGLVEPAPSGEELAWILRAALTVPDHGKLHPYRFVVVRGEARARFGDALAAALAEQRSEAPQGVLEKTRAKAFAAPLQIVLIASPREGMKIPEWEQVASASCTGFAIALAAHALGLGAIWKSAGVLDGTALRAVFELASTERLLGWVNLGHVEGDVLPREALDPAPFVRELGPTSLVPLP